MGGRERPPAGQQHGSVSREQGMTAYRWSWTFACALAVASGLAVTLTWPTGSTVALYLVCAFLLGTARIHLNLSRIDDSAPDPVRSVMRGVAASAGVGGLAMVALLGLSTVIGTWLLLVCLLLAGSSPGVLRWCRRNVVPAGVAGDHRPGPDDLPPVRQRSAAVECEVRGLTDTALCQAWRSSFLQLRAATSPTLRAEIVATRQAYLDELARRNPAGVTAWMCSGTPAPEDASPVLSSSSPRPSETSINWDAVLFGEDDS